MARGRCSDCSTLCLLSRNELCTAGELIDNRKHAQRSAAGGHDHRLTHRPTRSRCTVAGRHGRAAEQFQNSAFTSVEQVINELPQFVTGTSSGVTAGLSGEFLTADVQPLGDELAGRRHGQSARPRSQPLADADRWPARSAFECIADDRPEHDSVVGHRERRGRRRAALPRCTAPTRSAASRTSSCATTFRASKLTCSRRLQRSRHRRQGLAGLRADRHSAHRQRQRDGQHGVVPARERAQIESRVAHRCRADPTVTAAMIRLNFPSVQFGGSTANAGPSSQSSGIVTGNAPSQAAIECAVPRTDRRAPTFRTNSSLYFNHDHSMFLVGGANLSYPGGLGFNSGPLDGRPYKITHNFGGTGNITGTTLGENDPERVDHEPDGALLVLRPRQVRR